nr:hypothetical protein [uncultured Halomonas sp.]
MKSKRKDALEAGDMFYFTGKPCSNGHISKRYASGACVKCAVYSGKKWKKQNPEKAKESAAKTQEKYREKTNFVRRELYSIFPEAHRERSRQYRAKNPEKVKQQRKKSYIKNKQKRREESRFFTSNNRSLVNEKRREKYPRNKPKISAIWHKRRAAKLERTLKNYGELDQFCLEEAYQQCKDMEQAFGIPWDIDHMIPLQACEASGLHSYTNIQVIPRSLNASKCNRMIYTEPLDWLSDAT